MIESMSQSTHPFSIRIHCNQLSTDGLIGVTNSACEIWTELARLDEPIET